jgi:hypothetical protein
VVVFFDLLSFFGVVAFFAWLGYAPLQAQLLRRKSQKQEKEIQDDTAQHTLDMITDYFLVSFLSFSAGALTDYVYHHRVFIALAYDYRFAAMLVMGASFVLGMFTLLVPMIYLRARNLEDITLPPFFITFCVAFMAASATVIWVLDFALSKTIVGMALSLLSGILLYVGAVQLLRRQRPKWKFYVYVILTAGPIIVLFLIGALRGLPL